MIVREHKIQGQGLTEHSYVEAYNEEFDLLKRERRPGRPASTREDLLRIKIAADMKEYEDGFCQSQKLSLILEVC